ncbi:MAG TPA: ABC transporter permease, partial [Candidatus Norongarragalinales archaeon]|nr:ABC transporter permease [Candidatus Norongarragalinales archaeon]
MVAVAELFLLALGNLRRRKLRSMLTIIGIFIGITAVVALISLGQGLQNVVAGEFAKMGSDKITIMGYNGIAASPFVSATLSKPLTTDELRIVKRSRGIDLAGEILLSNVIVSYKRETKLVFASGIPEDDSRKMIIESQDAEVSDGRFLEPGEGKSVLIGSYAADGLFEKKIFVGDTIKIQDQDYRVVGVLESVGNRIDDSAIYLNLQEFRRLINQPKTVSMIIAKLKTGEEPSKVAENIEEDLRKYRNEEEGSENFQVSTSEELMASFAMILGVVQAVIVGIAAISLLVGAVGIMNTMYTSVVERTKEIGLMKAVGARNSDITLVFLFESGLLGLAGGVLGVLLGATFGKIAEIMAQQALGSNTFAAAITPTLVLGALAFAFVIGTISGVL